MSGYGIAQSLYVYNASYFKFIQSSFYSKPSPNWKQWGTETGDLPLNGISPNIALTVALIDAGQS